MAAFVDTVAALHAHLASVAHLVNERKQQKAQREGRPVCSAAAPPGAAFVAAELVKLLQQFPSGVSSAVMYTHVTERWGAQARCTRTALLAWRALGLMGVSSHYSDKQPNAQALFFFCGRITA